MTITNHFDNLAEQELRLGGRRSGGLPRDNPHQVEPARSHFFISFRFTCLCSKDASLLMKWVPLMQHDQGGHTHLNPRAKATCRKHDPTSYLGNLLLGRSLDGHKATKGKGRMRWAPMALIRGVEPHDHLTLCSSRLH
jgi:hypothetical protein